MKVLAYYPILYGAEYLHASIKSIEPFVDRIIILYTDTPSYGFHSSTPCPESETQLKQIAFNASAKVEWRQIKANWEGQHRDIIFQFTEGYDLLLAVDADEVWNQEDLKRCLEEAHKGDHWRYNINGFLNFWKSFNHVCVDYFRPGRIFNLRSGNRAVEGELKGTVYHFSTAQSKTIMDWKWQIHGHKNEISPDWLQKKYYEWTPETRWLHPASQTVWEKAEAFDKNTLPEILKQHENFNKEVIS